MIKFLFADFVEILHPLPCEISNLRTINDWILSNAGPIENGAHVQKTPATQ